jgi:hypothetical protein
MISSLHLGYTLLQRRHATIGATNFLVEPGLDSRHPSTVTTQPVGLVPNPFTLRLRHILLMVETTPDLVDPRIHSLYISTQLYGNVNKKSWMWIGTHLIYPLHTIPIGTQEILHGASRISNEGRQLGARDI